MKKTLVWHQGALGDLILSLPAIYAIKCDAGTELLHLVSRTDLQGILLANGIIDEASSNDSGFFSPLFGSGGLPERLKNFLLEFNKAFVFTRSTDASFFRQIGKYIPGSFHLKTVPPAGDIIHVSDFQLSGVRSAGLGSKVLMPVLDAAVHADSGSSRHILTFHPGSGGRRKCWPIENYLDLISVLSESGGHTACILLGPAEGDEVFRSVAEGMDKRGISADIVRGRPVSYVASLLKSSSLYVGNDSGITHLASALGVPTVALFGPTDHRLWRPTGICTRVMRSELPCSPCTEERYRECGERRCLETISVGAVRQGIAGLIGGPA
jgi:hypothetical protein